MSLHESCGVFGIFAPEEDVARLTYFALFALQSSLEVAHRLGRRGAGVGVSDVVPFGLGRGLDDRHVARLGRADVPVPRPGDIWGLNFVRVHRGTEYSQWVRTYTSGGHSPDDFGVLRFN